MKPINVNVLFFINGVTEWDFENTTTFFKKEPWIGIQETNMYLK